MSGIFPEGMEQKIRELLEVLNGTSNSYTINIYRYAGEREYRAEIGINELTSLFAVANGDGA